MDCVRHWFLIHPDVNVGDKYYEGPIVSEPVVISIVIDQLPSPLLPRSHVF